VLRLLLLFSIASFHLFLLLLLQALAEGADSATKIIGTKNMSEFFITASFENRNLEKIRLCPSSLLFIALLQKLLVIEPSVLQEKKP